MGRKKLSKEKQLGIIILFRSDKRLHEQIHFAAKEQKISASNLIRRIIINYLTAKKIWNIKQSQSKKLAKSKLM